MSSTTQIANRIKDRILQYGNPQEIDQLNLDTIDINKFTPDISLEISKCLNLKYLTINHCQLSSLENFPHLPYLTCLQLIGNKFKGSQLAHIVCNDTIQQLAVDQNKIDKIQDLLFLNDLPQLQHLQIRENPICSISEYRSKIFSIAPHIKIIDCQDKYGDEDVMFGTQTDSENSDNFENESVQGDESQQREEVAGYTDQQDSQERHGQKIRKHAK